MKPMSYVFCELCHVEVCGIIHWSGDMLVCEDCAPPTVLQEVHMKWLLKPGGEEEISKTVVVK